MKRIRGLFVLCTLWSLAMSNSAQACSVCFGDPDSPMTKGAVAGVAVMVGIIGFVLMGIAGTACLWMVRGRRYMAVERQGDLESDGPDSTSVHP